MSAFTQSDPCALCVAVDPGFRATATRIIEEADSAMPFLPLDDSPEGWAKFRAESLMEVDGRELEFVPEVAPPDWRRVYQEVPPLSAKNGKKWLVRPYAVVA